MKKITVTGKSIEDAVKIGLERLNATEDKVKIHIIEHPSKGLFGFGAKVAKVELELSPDALDEAIQFLDRIFQLMDLKVVIEKDEDDKEAITLNLSGSELGILIGRRGQTLDALQYLVNIIANRYSNIHLRVILDAENFRARRKKTLQQLSLRLADRVIKTGKEVILEPMSSLERKVIHSYLQEHPKVKTYSKGEDPNRRVVIVPR